MFGLGACCCLVGGFDNCFCCMLRWFVGGLVKGMLAVLWFGFVSWVWPYCSWVGCLICLLCLDGSWLWLTFGGGCLCFQVSVLRC